MLCANPFGQGRWVGYPRRVTQIGKVLKTFADPLGATVGKQAADGIGINNLVAIKLQKYPFIIFGQPDTWKFTSSHQSALHQL